MFSLAVWVFTGVTVGLMAWGARSANDHRPVAGMLVVGVFGAILGGVIAAAIWPTWVPSPDRDQDIFPGWLLSGVASAAVLAVYLSVSGSREAHHRA